MEWYFASRRRHGEKINYLCNFISKYPCHKISLNWTDLGDLKPYNKNRRINELISDNISKAIMESDVFTMISDKEGTDMFIELGNAMGGNILRAKPRIYVVGPYNNRSLMHFHSSINRVKSIEDVFKNEFPEILKNKNFVLPEFNFD